MSWSNLAEWWRDEIENDPAYESVVTPLLLEMLEPEDGGTYVDIGCGEGRVMWAVSAAGARVYGADSNGELLAGLPLAAVADAVSLPFRDDCFDGAYCVLTLEHVEDHLAFFSESARVTRSGGALVIVVNHPVWTSPHSTPITDQDGEVLWRPGCYFSTGTTEIPAGDNSVIFHHRTMADLLTTASDAGWHLERVIEQPHHELEGQSGIPRLLACRWRLLDTET